MNTVISIILGSTLIGVIVALLPTVDALPVVLDTGFDVVLPYINGLYTVFPLFKTFIEVFILVMVIQTYWIVFKMANWVYDKLIR